VWTSRAGTVGETVGESLDRLAQLQLRRCQLKKFGKNAFLTGVRKVTTRETNYLEKVET